MNDGRVEKWLISANNDFIAAGNLLFVTKEKIVTNVICYLCQQSAEKFLKAYLLNNREPFPRTHNLELLIEKYRKADQTFPDLDIGRLTSYNISMRYPDEFRIPTLEEAQVSYETSRIVRGEILLRLKIAENEITLFN
ncbi:MAG: HEPN domain-containing protein [Ignavibacteria bacterium]|nr:HEPN domain-containing protein [Ignavibacteria bacterium]MCC7159541.1 HEPN domain-containing protein [Ignavibacteria bacterium]